MHPIDDFRQMPSKFERPLLSPDAKQRGQTTRPSTDACAVHDLHADPDSPHAVWFSIVELRVFMQTYVFSRMETELRNGTPRAQRLRVSANKKNDPEAMMWFIDSSVYSCTQNLK